MKVSNDTSEGQDTLRGFVGIEVICSANQFMYGVSKDLEASARMFDVYSDDIYNLFSKTDWQSAAEYEGWEEIDGYIIKRLPRSDTEVEDWMEGEELDVKFADCSPNMQEDFRKQCEIALEEATDSWEEACDVDRLEAYEHEALEHWVVSEWLGEKLAEAGEIVGEFAGFTIWGRTCSGQAIFLDGVIEHIYNEWRA